MHRVAGRLFGGRSLSLLQEGPLVRMNVPTSLSYKGIQRPAFSMTNAAVRTRLKQLAHSVAQTRLGGGADFPVGGYTEFEIAGGLHRNGNMEMY